VLRTTSQLPSRRGLWHYLEAAYFMCYPAVPLGVVVLQLAGHHDSVDRFWTVVLPPSLLCYALTVVFPNLAPRQVESDAGYALRRPGVGHLNEWVLRRAAIAGNTFPSGHVASTLAVALVLLDLIPVAGVVFLWVAASIVLSTVILRYHYTTDAVLGASLACLSFASLG
jgi:membrane-associated phospholipid phosphatase